MFTRHGSLKTTLCVLLTILFIWESALPLSVFAYSEFKEIKSIKATPENEKINKDKLKSRNKKAMLNDYEASDTLEIIVKYKKNASKSVINKKAKTKVVKNIDNKNAQVVKASDKKGLVEALNIYKKDPNVEYAEPNYLFKASYVPNDPSFFQQWPLGKTLVPQAWELQKASGDIKIAIIDTGVDLDHEDLAAGIISGYDFVENDSVPDDANGHGTHVAGIAAGILNNGKGISGVAGGAKIVPVRVLDASGLGSLENVAAGITWAADQGVQVINLSLGSPLPSYHLEEAINYAYGKGVVVVAATGNEASGVSYPAAYANVIAVGATAADDEVAGFSNFGSEVDVVAPGVNILSTLPNAVVNTEFPWPLNYGYLSGTSMAAPFVAGVAGLLLSQNPLLTPSQVRDRLANTADDLGSLGFDDYYGHGRVNVFKALNTSGLTDLTDQFESNNTMSSAINMQPNQPLAGTFYPQNDEDWFKYNLINGKYKITLTVPKNIDGRLQIYGPDGSQINDVNIAGTGVKESVILSVSAPGNYFFKLSDVTGSLGNEAYTFEVDEVDSFEPNNDLLGATLTQLNQDILATLNPRGDEDFYKVVIPQDGVVSINLQVPTDLDGVIHLYNSQNEVVAEMDWGYQGQGELLSTQLRAEEYYVKISDFLDSSSRQPYTLRINHIVGLTDSYEVNDTLTGAAEIKLNEDIKAKINPSGDLDYYKFTIPQTRKVQISLKSPSLMDGMFTLLNSSGVEITFVDNEIEGIEEKLEREISPGTYYVLVEDFWYKSHQLEYTLRVNVDLTPPTVTLTNPASDASNVSVDGPIAITFSENILAGSNYEGITIKDNQGNSIAINKIIESNILKLQPTLGMDYDKFYTVSLPVDAVKDGEGNSLANEYSFGFQTEPDLLPLMIESSSPSENGQNFFVDKDIVIYFNKYVLQGDTFSQIKLTSVEGEELAISSRIEGKKLIIDPVNSLSYETSYNLTLPAGAIKSSSGTVLVGEWSLNFQTGGLVQSNLVKLPFRVNDIVVDPNTPVVYGVSKQEKKLYKIDYQTGDIQSVTFEKVPESIDLGKGEFSHEIYVTLVHGEHSSYWWSDNQSGSIAIIDKEPFQVKETFTIQVDPWDIIAGRDGHIYVPSGSGQWTNFDSYSRVTKTRTGRSSISERSYAKLHPTLNRIYTITTESSPRDFTAYNTSNGNFIGRYDSPYHGDHALNINYAIDPTGQFIFNGSGNIFKLNSSQSSDMVYHGKLNLAFTDIAFEKDLSKIYTIPLGIKAIYAYDGQSYGPVGNISLLGKGINVFNKEGEILALIEAEKPERNFLTGIQVISKVQDTTSPVLTSITPNNGSKEVPAGQQISITFNENIVAGESVTNIRLQDSTGQNLATVNKVKGNTLTIKPVDVLNNAETYTVEVPVGAVKDLNDNLWTEGQQLVFTTEKARSLGDLFKLPYEADEALIDPEGPYLYLLSKGDKKLVKVNHETGQSQALSLEYTPVNMDFGKGLYNKELYVLLSDSVNGKVVVINKDSFELVSSFDTLQVPFDLASTRDGHIMVSRPSGVDSYHRATGQLVSQQRSFYHRTEVKLHPLFDKLYGITLGSSPTDIIAYNFSDGKVLGSYDSIYHGDYPLNDYFEIDPTGLFLFNGNGNIFSLSAAGRTDDMRYVTKLDAAFSNITFDLGSQKMYTLSQDGRYLNIFDSNEFSLVDSLPLQDSGKFIFSQNGKLISIVQPTSPTSDFKSGVQLISKTKPLLTVSSLTDGMYTNQKELVVEGVTEPGNIITINGQEVPVDLNGKFSKVVWLEEGSNTILVLAKNSFGETTVRSTSIVLDTAPPQLSLTEPQSAGFSNSRVITVKGLAEKDSIVYVNNELVQSDDRGNFTYNIQAPADGNFEITAIAQDKAGNQTIVKRTVMVDTIYPDMAKVTVPQLSKTNLIRVTWEANDSFGGSGINAYDIQVKEVGSDLWKEVKFDHNLNYFDFAGEDGKRYYFQVRAKDRAGNAGIWLNSSEVRIDSSAPSNIVLTVPTYKSGTSYLYFKATDPNNGTGVDSYDLEYRKEGTSTWTRFVSKHRDSKINGNFGSELGGYFFIRVRAYDVAGNISSWTDGSHKTFVDQVHPEALITTPSKTGALTFRVNWSAKDFSPGSGIAGYDIRYRIGGTSTWQNWKTNVTGTSADFTGSLGKTYYFAARVWDKAGNISNWKYSTGTTIADMVKPIMKTVNVPLYSTSVSKTRTIKISWSASDAAPSSGLASYDIQYRKGGSATWVTWKTNYTSTWANFTGAAGTTYYFRIRAKDKQGNVGGWTSGTHKTIVPYDNNSIISSRSGFGAIYTNSSSNHYLGTLRYSTRANEYITYKFTGNKLALIGYKGPGRSKLKIYIDGVYKATVDTYSATPKYRQIIYITSWSKAGTHTIKIVNMGTSGRKRVDIDGIAVGR